MEAARQRPEIGNVFTSFDPRYPQVKVDLDREKARKLGVPINEVFQAMSAVLGGTYVNDFNRFGRLFRVYVQADSDYRRKPDDIGDIYVRSRTTNEMVPLSTLVKIDVRVRHRDHQPLQPVPLGGDQRQRRRPASARDRRWRRSRRCSRRRCRRRWASPTVRCRIRRRWHRRRDRRSPSRSSSSFLLLAALYESWRLPWAVLLGSPLVALGSFFGVWLMGYDNNVYVQIGNIMLIGLAAKNAILIVEFAKAKHDEGMPVEEAALESARLRFRPILMTAFAFILGVVPLMIASGAGAGGAERHGHGGVLRHAGRDVPGRLPHPRQLRLRRGARPKAGDCGSAGTGGGGA